MRLWRAADGICLPVRWAAARLKMSVNGMPINRKAPLPADLTLFAGARPREGVHHSRIEVEEDRP